MRNEDESNDEEPKEEKTNAQTNEHKDNKGDDLAQHNSANLRNQDVLPTRFVLIHTGKKQQGRSLLKNQQETSSNPTAAMILAFVGPPLINSQSLPSSTTQSPNPSTSKATFPHQKSDLPGPMILGVLKPISTISPGLHSPNIPKTISSTSKKRTSCRLQEFNILSSKRPASTKPPRQYSSKKKWSAPTSEPSSSSCKNDNFCVPQGTAFQLQKPNTFSSQNNNLPLIQQPLSTTFEQHTPSKTEHETQQASSDFNNLKKNKLSLLLAIPTQHLKSLNLNKNNYYTLTKLDTKEVTLTIPEEENYCPIHGEISTIENEHFLHVPINNSCVICGNLNAIEQPTTSSSQQSSGCSLDIPITTPYQPTTFTPPNFTTENFRISPALACTPQEIVVTISQGIQSVFSQRPIYSRAPNCQSYCTSTITHPNISENTKSTPTRSYEFYTPTLDDAASVREQRPVLDGSQGTTVLGQNGLSNTVEQMNYVLPSVLSQNTCNAGAGTATRPIGNIQNNHDAICVTPRRPRLPRQPRQPRPPRRLRPPRPPKTPKPPRPTRPRRRRVRNQNTNGFVRINLSPPQLPQVESLFEGDLGLDTTLFPELYI